MTNRKTWCVLAGVAALALGVALPVKAVEAKKVETPKTVDIKTAQTLDFASLGKFLDDMGYDYKKLSDTSYQITLKRDGWTIYVTADFSGDKTRLWLGSSLGDVKNIKEVPAVILEKMLETNYTHGPTHFAVIDPKDSKNKDLRRLKIYRPLDNRGLTKKLLREEIDALFTTIRDTKSVWLQSEWKKNEQLANGKTKEEVKVKKADK